MKIAYRKIRLSKANKQRLDIVNGIVEEYRVMNYRLTLRQLYYQLVSRDIIPNNDKEYKKLGKLIKEGRMAGIVSWDAIEDRLRVPKSAQGWDSPKSILMSAADQFRAERDKDQPKIEVWVEKDALSSIVNRSVRKYNIASMVNRGYSSASAMHDAFMRFQRILMDGEKATILYLGDHDPSGLDMVRDIKTRLIEFCIGDSHLGQYMALDYGQSNDIELLMYDMDEQDLDIVNQYEDPHEVRTAIVALQLINVEPIALTMDQIKEYNPPPNPAKLTDTRSKWYTERFGYKSWEVDALNPEVLEQLITSKVQQYYDVNLLEEVIEKEKETKKKLMKFIETFEE